MASAVARQLNMLSRRQGHGDPMQPWGKRPALLDDNYTMIWQNNNSDAQFGDVAKASRLFVGTFSIISRFIWRWGDGRQSLRTCAGADALRDLSPRLLG
jgi:hypothetical protein